jgi:hypothetical protein
MSSNSQPEPTPAFPDCTAEHVFNEINSQVGSAEARALWGRMQAEIKRQGTGAATTYLAGEFTRLKQEFKRELETVKSD